MVPQGRIDIDTLTGAISAIHLGDPETAFVRQPSGAGLVRIAAPLDHYASHFIETGTHAQPVVSREGDEILLRYENLVSGEGSFPVTVEIRLRPSEDGLIMSASVHNGWNEPLPQIIFPQLMDLEAVG